MSSSAAFSRRVTRKNLTDYEKRIILDEILNIYEGELQSGTVKVVEDNHGLDRRQIRKIWKRYKHSEEEEAPVDLTTERKGRS